MKRTILISKKDGSLQWLTPPPFPVPVLSQTTERFSEITPVNPIKRATFKLLRRMFGEQGKVADWTRRWLCLWECRILLGKHRGEAMRHELRPLLIEWEQQKFAESKGVSVVDVVSKILFGRP